MSRYLTVKEEYILTPMTEDRFGSILSKIECRDVDVLYDAELKEFGRLCRALLEGKDIFFTHPCNEEECTKWVGGKNQCQKI